MIRSLLFWNIFPLAPILLKTLIACQQRKIKNQSTTSERFNMCHTERVSTAYSHVIASPANCTISLSVWNVFLWNISQLRAEVLFNAPIYFPCTPESCTAPVSSPAPSLPPWTGAVATFPWFPLFLEKDELSILDQWPHQGVGTPHPCGSNPRGSNRATTHACGFSLNILNPLCYFKYNSDFQSCISSAEGSHRQEVICDQPSHTMQPEWRWATELIRSGQAKRSKEMHPALIEVQSRYARRE